MEKHDELPLSYLFAHLHLLASHSLSSLIISLFVFFSLTLPTSAFPTVHIVRSLISKLPSTNKKSGKPKYEQSQMIGANTCLSNGCRSNRPTYICWSDRLTMRKASIPHVEPTLWQRKTVEILGSLWVWAVDLVIPTVLLRHWWKW